MFLALSQCPIRLSASSQGVSFGLPATKRAIPWAAVAAATLVAVLAIRQPQAPAIQVPLPAGVTATMITQDASALPALSEAADRARLALLDIPGVGSVRSVGLQTAGIDLYVSPARLAREGVSMADLHAAVATDGGSPPGVLHLRPDAAQMDVQAVANLPVVSGRRVFRLGDLAAVARTRLAAPISRLQRDGHPAVDLAIIPAPGADRAELRAAVASRLGKLAMRAPITLLANTQ